MITCNLNMVHITSQNNCYQNGLKYLEYYFGCNRGLPCLDKLIFYKFLFQKPNKFIYLILGWLTFKIKLQEILN